jgi:hypothetical protein
MKKNFLLIKIALLISFLGKCQTQESDFRVYLGLGLTDMLHLGIAKSVRNWDIGPQAGYFKHDLGRIVTVGVSASLNIRRSDKFPGAPTLFFKQLLNYQNDKNTGYKQWYWLTTELLFGRNFYFSKNFGISVEGGALVTLYQLEKYNERPAFIEDDEGGKYPVVFPGIRIQVFSRF